MKRRGKNKRKLKTCVLKDITGLGMKLSGKVLAYHMKGLRFNSCH